MTPLAHPERYKHHHFPGESLSHGVWLHDRFSLRSRDMEEMLFARDVVVTYEAIRQWWKVGPECADQLKRQRPRTGDK